MKRSAYYISLSVALIALWEYLGSSNQTFRLLLSSPSLVYRFFSANLWDLLSATKTTLFEAVCGLLIATAFSFGVMVLCFYKPKVMEFILPIMVTSQVIPLIVLAPFFIILLGIGVSSKIAMAALMCFFPVFVNFAHGYRSISGNIHELMHIYDAPRKVRIRHVYFPLSTGSIMAGLKVSATLAVIGAIVAEFTGAQVGLGKNLFISAIRLEPDLMMSSLLLSTVIGLSLYGSIRLVEKRVFNWYE